jgi:hypothetical protein
MNMKKAEFVEYLKSTLIPDLLESGSEATAVDFMAAVEFINGAKTVFLDNDEVAVYAD